MNNNNSRIISFKNAFAGIFHVIRTQRNTWIYLVVTILVILAGILLHIDWYEWLFLIIFIGLIWSAECFNTAIESVVDLASPELHPIAKIAKDTAAAGVLILAIGAALVGIIILGRHLYLLITSSGE
jgi:diacylglycerol kinase